MKLIKSSFEILEQGSGLDGVYEAIERAGRTCYASSHNIKYKYINPLVPDTEYDPDYVSTWSTGDKDIGVTTTAEDFYNKYGIFIRKSTTAKNFVDRMIASQHYAMLEHGTVYLKIPVYFANCIDDTHEKIDLIINSPYSKVNYDTSSDLENMIDWTMQKISTECIYITTNYRVLVEQDALCLLEYLCEPTEHHERRVTVRFTTDQGVLREFTRHRVFSFAVESTRRITMAA